MEHLELQASLKEQKAKLANRIGAESKRYVVSQAEADNYLIASTKTKLRVLELIDV